MGKSKGPESEALTRKKILANAKMIGCEKEVAMIMHKYDQLLFKCTNQVERQQIAIMGAAELHRYMMVRGPLIIDGQEIIPAEPGFKEE